MTFFDELKKAAAKELVTKAVGAPCEYIESLTEIAITGARFRVWREETEFKVYYRDTRQDIEACLDKGYMYSEEQIMEIARKILTLPRINAVQVSAWFDGGNTASVVLYKEWP